MKTPETDLCSLVELYALDGLDRQERRLFELHLEQCQQCQHSVKSYRRSMEELLHDVPMTHEPPADLKGRVLQHVKQAATGPNGAVPVPNKTRRRWRWEYLAIAAALLIAVYTSGSNIVLQRQLAVANRARAVGTVARQVGLQASGAIAAKGKATVLRLPDHRSMLLISVAGLKMPTAKQVYQVWYVKGSGVQSAGTFVPLPDGQALFAAPMARSIASVQAIAITLEPSAYDRQPKGPKVLVGSLLNA